MFKQIFDENSANEVLTEHEVELALGAFELDLKAHLQKVLQDRIAKDGADWYEKSKLTQVGCTTGEEVIY